MKLQYTQYVIHIIYFLLLDAATLSLKGETDWQYSNMTTQASVAWCE